jgi:hypothetical protein
MNADDIQRIANEIRHSSVSASKKADHFKETYPVFAEKYPMLFELACNPSADFTHLDYMIAMLKNIEKNKMTSEIASANVGQKMFDIYVKPNLPEKDTDSSTTSL